MVQMFLRLRLQCRPIQPLRIVVSRRLCTLWRRLNRRIRRRLIAVRVRVRVRGGWICLVRPGRDLVTRGLRLWLHLLLLARILTPPPLIFDQPSSRNTGRLLSDDSANVEGSEDAWAELKVRTSLVRLSKLLCM